MILTDSDTAELPDGSPNGSPTRPGLLGFPTPVEVNELDVDGLGGKVIHLEHRDATGVQAGPNEVLVGDQLVTVPPDLAIKPGSLMFAAAHDFRSIFGVLMPHYRTPPDRAQYLLLFHELDGVSGMCINGRTWLGNTPTVLGGPQTQMRFGVVGMGDSFHTFHLHGHR
ncbi:MAG TPA: hypothetical protein VGH31_05405, partial [Acidimicrobiales bacterium]